jgi:secondary thiamine-phosphate synthase enzyme
MLPASRFRFAFQLEKTKLKSHTKYMTFNTAKRRELVRITDEVAACCRDSGIAEGMLLVSAMHITAGVFINDDESGLHADIEEWVQRLAPGPAADDRTPGPAYRHHHSGEDNGDAHLKNLLIGHQVIVPITKGKLDLGPWQQIFYYEFDGRRPKRLVMKAIGE